MSDGRHTTGEPAMSGPEHDAWLREALRHAPDAGAAPPPTLRDAILAEARAAARTGKTSRATSAPSLLGRALEFWSWLARPPVAAGFASVMAATLVGMLWWDRPIDETMVPAPASPPVVAAPAARSETPPATGGDRLQEAPRPPAAEPAPRDAAPAASRIDPPRAAEDAAALETARRQQQQQQQQQATREETGARARAASEAKAKAAARGEAAKTESKDNRKSEAPAPFPARTPVEADAAVRPAEQQAARPTSPPATPSPSVPTTPSTAAAPPPPVAMPPPAPAMAPATAPPVPAPAAASPRPDAFAAAKGAESGEKESSLAKSRPVTAGPSARPMASLLAALASDDTRWSRRLPSGESAAVDAPLRDWLAQVQAAAPRWDAATGRSRDLQDRPASTTSPTTLRLDRDGRPGAIVQLEEGGVRFDPLTGSAWFAALPPEVVARLRATLPPAPR